jgi:hypothetical protein
MESRRLKAVAVTLVEVLGGEKVGPVPSNALSQRRTTGTTTGPQNMAQPLTRDQAQRQARQMATQTK